MPLKLDEKKDKDVQLQLKIKMSKKHRLIHLARIKGVSLESLVLSIIDKEISSSIK